MKRAFYGCSVISAFAKRATIPFPTVTQYLILLASHKTDPETQSQPNNAFSRPSFLGSLFCKELKGGTRFRAQTWQWHPARLWMLERRTACIRPLGGICNKSAVSCAEQVPTEMNSGHWYNDSTTAGSKSLWSQWKVSFLLQYQPFKSSTYEQKSVWLQLSLFPNAQAFQPYQWKAIFSFHSSQNPHVILRKDPSTYLLRAQTSQS